MARKQRQHEVAMYDKQKQDSIDFWKMENEYNSPAMQMQRLRDAKLNPNLIYGSPQPMGMAGNVDRPNMSVSDSYTQAGRGIQQAFQPIGGVMDHIYNLRLINAQTNNVNQNTQTQKSTEALNYATKALRILEQGYTYAKTYNIVTGKHY